MSPEHGQVRAGRVGRPHGLDGSFYVEGASADLAEGTEVTVAGRPTVVERRGGTDARPLVRLQGVADRDAAATLRGAELLLEAGGDLKEGEYLAEDLVGCRIAGLGEVRRVISAPSCDLLEVGDDALLIPLVSDAVALVDIPGRAIEVNRAFLGLDEEPGDAPPRVGDA